MRYWKCPASANAVQRLAISEYELHNNHKITHTNALSLRRAYVNWYAVVRLPTVLSEMLSLRQFL